MKYFFVLGTNTTLSVAEIFSVRHLEKPLLLAPDFLVAESQYEINAPELIKRLGGSIKIGRIVAEIDLNNDRQLETEIVKLANVKEAQTTGGKFNFGISSYGKVGFNKKNLGLKVKNSFTSKKISSRFVISREKTLSSVVVTQNKMINRGLEIVLAAHNKLVLVGETLAVQPFKDLSLRDYGRPARDDLSGMLPPKLAQIMLNLAQLESNNTALIDPFCGSGTILTEAALLGCKNIFGSDLSFKAVQDTKKNISWVKELYKLGDFKLKLFVKNVVDLSKFVKGETIDAVVTEPYLGPQRGQIDFPTVIKNLEELYTLAIKEFYKILEPGGRVVMIWPVYYGQRPINPDYQGFVIKNMIPEEFRQSEFISKNKRGTIIYNRPGQKVYREIVVLDKI